MYARLQIAPALPENVTDPGALHQVIEVLKAQRGFRAAHLLLQIGARKAMGLTLWDSRDDASLAPERTEAVLGPRPFTFAVDEVCEVLDMVRGPAALAEVTVAQATWFGPAPSVAHSSARRRAAEERIKPAIEKVDGLAVAYMLELPDDGAVAVTLTTATEALDRVMGAIFSTTLLPDEDPDLLADPERVELYRLVAQAVAPEPARS